MQSDRSELSYRAFIALLLTLVITVDAFQGLLFVATVPFIYAVLKKLDTSVVIVKSDPKVDIPKPEHKVETPKPKPKVDTPKPKLKFNTPKSVINIDTPKPIRKFDTPKSKLKFYTPKSSFKVDTPKPRFRAGKSTFVLKVAIPKPDLKFDTSKSPFKADTSKSPFKADTFKSKLKADTSKSPFKTDTFKSKLQADTPKSKPKSGIPKPVLKVDIPKPKPKVGTPKVATHKPELKSDIPKPVLKVDLTKSKPKVGTPNVDTHKPELKPGIPKLVLEVDILEPDFKVDIPESDVNAVMFEMETKAVELPAVLKNSNLSIDVKLSHLKGIKSDIKQSNVPEGAASAIFESLRLALSSQHPALHGAAFSTLGHLLKRLYIQEQHDLVSAYARPLFPALLDHLGDHKERVRAQAAEAFTELWKAAKTEVENHVLRGALVGKNPRAREMSMVWLSNMTKTHGLLFRAYVPSLVARLEDSDSGVRDTAKTTVVQLFQNASALAKSDLKKQLAAKNVRKSITNMILTSLGLSSSDPEPSTSRPVSRVENVHARPVSRVENVHPRPVSAMSKEDSEPEPSNVPTKNRPVPSKIEASRPVASEHHDTQEESSQRGDLEPLNVSTGKEFEDIVNDMLPLLDSKETEHNWKDQNQKFTILRRLARGNAPHDFPHEYLGTMRSLTDRIVKGLNSPRTIFSNSGSNLIHDVAKALGPKVDPMVEIFMQNLVKVCHQTNKIVVIPASVAVTAVLENASYTRANQSHVVEAYKDKNAYLRLQTAGWLKIMINKLARYRGSFELDNIATCLQPGVADPSPDVREAMRGTFWAFYGVFPEKANEVLSKLDGRQRSNVEKDPANPNKSQPKTPSQKPVAKGTSISALKAAIAAQKKKAHTRPETALPPRPESAQSAFSQVKTSDASSKPSNVPSNPSSERPKFSNAPPNPSHVRDMAARPHISSLSSAPVRPAMKSRRPELARPATADPYASRRPAAIDAHTKPATQLRTDSVHVDTTKGKPKKLDIKKTRVRGSDEQNTPASIQGPAMETGDSIPNSNVDLNDATKASDPVTIYEDPVSCASPDSDRDDGTIVPDDYPSRAAKSSATSMVPESAADGLAQRPIPGMDHVPEIPPTAIAMHHEFPASETHESPKISERSYSPACTVIHHSAIMSEYASPPQYPMGHYAMPIGQSPAGQIHTQNNENTWAVVGHAHPESPEQRVVSQSNALEELHTTEPAHRDNKKSQQAKDQPAKDQEAKGQKAKDQKDKDGKDSELEEDTSRRPWRRIEAAQLRWSISPLSKDPVVARGMVEKCIHRIRTSQMSVLLFRKLQGLVQYHDQMFTDEELFDQLLMALFEYMERPTIEKRQPLSREDDLKVQAVFTLRFMFKYNRRYFTAYYPRAMTAFVTAVKHLPPASAIPGGIKDLAEDVAGVCDEGEASGVVDAVLDLIVTEERSDGGYVAINMGAFIVNAFLYPFVEDARLPPNVLARVGEFAGRSLGNSRYDTRRQVLVLCRTLHSMVTEGRFWEVLGFVPVHSRSLLAYFTKRW